MNVNHYTNRGKQLWDSWGKGIPHNHRQAQIIADWRRGANDYWQMERSKGASITIWSAPGERSGGGALAHPIRKYQSGVALRLPPHSTCAAWDC
jgi:hypothetical protein